MALSCKFPNFAPQENSYAEAYTAKIKHKTIFYDRPQSQDAWVLAKPGITQAVAIASFAYMCHHSTFLLYGSLKQPSESRWKRLTHASVFTSALIEIFFAIFGYATFTGFVQGKGFPQ